MTRPRRPPRPGRKPLPQYVLRCTSGWFEGVNYCGCYYDGRNQATGLPRWLPPEYSPWFASRMGGAGLASAERALRRWGYTVERIPA